MTDTDLNTRSGLRGVPLALTPLTRKDVVSDAEVRSDGERQYARLLRQQLRLLKRLLRNRQIQSPLRLLRNNKALLFKATP